jgi:pimeloyl-ACP methyl ester carboxylesterase
MRTCTVVLAVLSVFSVTAVTSANASADIPGAASACPPPVSTQGAAPEQYSEPLRIGADPAKGFYSPYFLFVPTTIAEEKAASNLRFIVVPNNSGFTSDDPEAFEKDALSVICHPWRGRATILGVAVIVPAFPRPSTVYTHALARAAMTTNVPALRRPDLQLIDMIDDAIAREKILGLQFDSKVLLCGFSASGSFVNRFVFLHPDRVLAAAYGSPGGWPIAPLATWENVPLTYPVGIADVAQLTGMPVDIAAVARVPQFLFMGTDDTNDAVTYTDSFSPDQKEVVFRLFGPTLLSRWGYTEAFYRTYLPLTTLKLYPGVAHHVSPDMSDDFIHFFTGVLHAPPP